MPKHYVSIRIVNSSGVAVKDARVAFYRHQGIDTGFVGGDKRTNGEGQVNFDIEAKEFAEAEIYVNGSSRIPRAKIKGEYIIRL